MSGALGDRGPRRSRWRQLGESKGFLVLDLGRRFRMVAVLRRCRVVATVGSLLRGRKKLASATARAFIVGRLVGFGRRSTASLAFAVPGGGDGGGHIGQRAAVVGGCDFLLELLDLALE